MTKTNPMKLLLGAVAGVAAITLVFALSACGGSGTSGTTEAADGAADTKISVGVSPVPHADILENAVSKVLADEGYDLDVVVFQDYVLPNKSLEEGELDANYFQTLGYMQQQNEENGMHLKAVAGVHIEPMGIYSEKHASIDELAEGATIGVPNDPDNEERALEVLVQKGLLKSLGSYGENGNTSESLNGDAEANPSGFVITPLEAASLPLSLPDLDAAVINGNYALEAGLNPAEDALIIEAADSDESYKYINYLVVKEGNEESVKTLALIAAFSNQDVVDFINETYPGSVIPAADLAE